MRIETVIRTLDSSLRKALLEEEKPETLRIPIETVIMLLIWLPKVADLVATIRREEQT